MVQSTSDITDEFARFLLTRRIVDEKTLLKALNIQRKKSTLVGVIAIQEKMITVDQLQDILEKRLEEQRYFGEIAIDLGYLKDEDVEELLRIQKKRMPHLGKILFAMKAISEDVLAREWRFFKELHR